MATYKESGVDIDAGEDLIRRIKKPIRSTFNRNVLADIGMFGAFTVRISRASQARACIQCRWCRYKIEDRNNDESAR